MGSSNWRRRSKSSKSKSKRKNQVAQEKTKIEDYAFLSDTQTGALVSRDGSVDWLCVPRFDSPACFASLLGDSRHGRWLVAPTDDLAGVSRSYRPGTLVLETVFSTSGGTARIVDFMPPRGSGPPRLMRIVEGMAGRVPMQLELAVRPDYGSITPWVDDVSDGVAIVAGPDGVRLSTPAALGTGGAT